MIIWPLMLTYCVTLGEFLSLSGPQFFTQKTKGFDHIITKGLQSSGLLRICEH